MNHFRVELDTVEVAFWEAYCAILGVIAYREYLDFSFGEFYDLVAVRHPHNGFCVYTGKEIVKILHFEDSFAIFAGLASGDFAAQCYHHKLESVADAQHGNVEVEYFRIALWCVFGVDAGRAT